MFAFASLILTFVAVVLIRTIPTITIGPRKASKRTQSAVTLLQHGEQCTIENRVTDESLAKCNLQGQSPLFGVLPAELRNNIFELVTCAYDDPHHLYHETHYCYRPGHHAKHKWDTSLLLTCRRAWLEANHLPMRSAEPTFWFKNDDRRPDWTHATIVRSGKYSLRGSRHIPITEAERFKRFMERLTPNNIVDLSTVHIFAQLFWLQGNEARRLFSSIPMPRIPHVKITVRHTDWWWWENDEALEMGDDWIEDLLAQAWFADNVGTFTLELETLRGKVDQLLAIIDSVKRKYDGIRVVDVRVRRWVLDRRSGGEVLSWTGPTDIGEEDYGVYADMEKLEYRVFSLVWRVRED